MDNYYGKTMEPDRLFWSCSHEDEDDLIKQYSSKPYFCKAWAGWRRALHHHMYLVCLFEMEDGDHPLLKYSVYNPKRNIYPLVDGSHH